MATNETLVVLAIVLTLVVIWYLKWQKTNKPAENFAGLADALKQQEVKIESPVFVEQFQTPEEVVRAALASKRLELMTSSKNNSDDPLEVALGGGSVLNAM